MHCCRCLRDTIGLRCACLPPRCMPRCRPYRPSRRHGGRLQSGIQCVLQQPSGLCCNGPEIRHPLRQRSGCLRSKTQRGRCRRSTTCKPHGISRSQRGARRQRAVDLLKTLQLACRFSTESLGQRYALMPIGRSPLSSCCDAMEFLAGLCQQCGHGLRGAAGRLLRRKARKPPGEPWRRYSSWQIWLQPHRRGGQGRRSCNRSNLRRRCRF